MAPYKDTASGCQLCQMVVDSRDNDIVDLVHEPVSVMVKVRESIINTDQRRISCCDVSVGYPGSGRFTSLEFALWADESKV